MARIVERDGRKYLELAIPLLRLSRLKRSKLPAASPGRLLSLLRPAQTVALGFAVVGILGVLYLVFHRITTSERAQTPLGNEATPTPASAPKPATSESHSSDKNAELRVQFGKLLVELKAGNRRTDNYSVTPIPSREVVQGRRGDYFTVTIYDARQKSPFFFKAGEYTLRERDGDFGTSLIAFQRELVSKFLISKPQVFIEGKADIAGAAKFRKPLLPFECEGQSSIRIQFHRRLAGHTDKFESTLSEQILPKQISNSDLPLVRARYLQCKYRALYPETPTNLLEGDVDSDVNELSRKGTLILYVPAL